METKTEEAVEKKGVIRLMITSGPPELDFLFSFARRQFILLTVISTDLDSPPGSKMEMPVCIDGLEWLPGKPSDEPGWKIQGHFNADGQTSWVGHPDEKSGIQLWGGFSGDYNRRTRLGHIETVNHITMGEIADRIRREQSERDAARRKIWDWAAEQLKWELECLFRDSGEDLEYTPKIQEEVWGSVYAVVEEKAQAAGLRHDLRSDTNEYRSLRDFVTFSLRIKIDKLREAQAEKR